MLAFAVAVGVSASAFGAVIPTVYEDFTTNSDTRWIGFRNRPPNGVNDFGWRDSDTTENTVLSPSGKSSGGGELGGPMQRNINGGAPAVVTNDYGFPTGTLTPSDTLHADGVYRFGSGGGNYFFGWYNSAAYMDGIPDGGPRNFLGIQLDDGFKHFAHVARHDHRERGNNGPASISQTETVTWSMDYNGAGVLTATIGGDTIVVNAGGGYFSGSPTTFDRFGLFSDNTSGGVGDHALDDITFSSLNPVPEPASLGLLAMGAVAMLRRRRA
jgi:hypothetical protein